MVAGLAVILVLAAAAYWLHARRFEDSDDAQIDGNISNVSPRVSGNVSAVYVIENQSVKSGDVLAELDVTEVLIALAEAKAQVALAQAQLGAEDPSVSITQSTNQSALASARAELASSQAAVSAARSDVEQLTAQLAQASANDRTAQLERQRSERLLAQGAVSQSDFDQRANAAAASAASLDALRQSLAAARDRVMQQQAQQGALQGRLTEVVSNAPRQVETRRASVVMRQAALDLANAQLALAEKNVSYTKIIAPVTGIVAKKSLALGDHVAPGQQVVAIAQTDTLWVTANFRETQLSRMQPGQPASVHVDAIGVDLSGVVESIGGATGSRLSVLPPENASGNYVKVVQRIPVRIRLDPGQPGMDRLRIGMSVEPKVTVR
ncbi:MAG: HlyD family secretion protein [Myxococcota bacterium]|nr:HlyD family secretion protein [Myxococcota bacterium]